MGKSLIFPCPGVDYSFARPNLQQLKADGYKFVGRYVTGTGGKALSVTERDHIHAEGLHIALFYEEEAEGPLGGHSEGVVDAAHAASMCHSLGVPEHIVVYFAIDYEMTASRAAATRKYLTAADSYLQAHGYSAGSYGGFGTVQVAHEAGIRYFCQTEAWSGGKWDARSTLEQRQVNVEVAGGQVDVLHANESFGGWAP